jgi:hypothetical protein
MDKPSLFIGSSTEGLEFARAIRTLLARDADVTLWNEGFFKLGSTFIESLVNSLPRFDFAALVLTKDDLVESRNLQTFGPRDNVVFELGLFMGGLGRSRTFIVHQADAKIKIPTDLSGVNTATYQWPRKDMNYDASVGPAADSIRRVIQELGFSDAKTSKQIQGVRERQEAQQSEIEAIRVAVRGILTKHEFGPLKGLSGPGKVELEKQPNLINYLHRLDGLEFIQPNPGYGLWDIEKKPNGDKFDLREYFYITDAGKNYLETTEYLEIFKAEAAWYDPHPFR